MQGMYFLGQDLCTPLYCLEFHRCSAIGFELIYFHFEIDPRLPKDLCTLKQANRVKNEEIRN